MEVIQAAVTHPPNPLRGVHCRVGRRKIRVSFHDDLPGVFGAGYGSDAVKVGPVDVHLLLVRVARDDDVDVADGRYRLRRRAGIDEHEGDSAPCVTDEREMWRSN
jgi:hypothetical protein